MERDVGVTQAVKDIFISTHTLTWSVTPCSWRSASEKSISTHTLTWSVTVAAVDSKADAKHFNSHAHVERDVTLNFLGIKRYFNSHAHVERDSVCFSSASSSGNFNSHAHVERDLDVVYIWCLLNVMRTYFFI